MTDFMWRAENEADTDRLAAALAATAPQQAVVSLHGPLGAGKSRLVRGLAAAAGVDPSAVVSPTFVLCQTYRGDLTLHHFDAYRLADEDEFLELGADEYMESNGITLVEWGERVEACLPADRLDLQIEIDGETRRRFTLRPGGNETRQWVERIEGKLADDASSPAGGTP